MTNLSLHGYVYWYTNGTIDVYQQPIIRSTTFDPADYNSETRVDPAYRAMAPFNLRAGTVSIRPAAKTDIPLPQDGGPALFVSGRATISSGAQALGGLTDFGVWGLSALEDPSVVMVEAATENSTGGVGQAWTRHHAVVTLPKSAKYLAVGGKFYSVPSYDTLNKRRQYLKKVQVEELPLGTTTPTAYSSAREIRTTIHPDRVNYACNPDFWNDTSYWSGVTRTADSYARSDFTGQIAVTANTPANVDHTIPVVRKGAQHLIQVLVRTSKPVTISKSVVSGATVVGAAGPQIIPATTDGAPVRLFVQPTSNGPVTVRFTLLGAADATVKFNEMLVEETTKLDRLFFDGSTYGDAVWEGEGSEGSTRSYFYKNRAERYAAVVRILRDNAPLGIGVADPQFGVLPVGMR